MVVNRAMISRMNAVSLTKLQWMKERGCESSKCKPDLLADNGMVAVDERTWL